MSEPSKLDVFEDRLGLALTMAVAGVALAASFSHVHELTQSVLATQTGEDKSSMSWLGWVNACCSELLPLLGTLSLRRRHNAGMGIGGYPLWLVIGGAVLSLTVQIQWVGGLDKFSFWACLFAVLPAVTFLLLTKLIVSQFDVSKKISGQAEEEAAARQAEVDALASADRKRAEAEARAEVSASTARKAQEEAAALRAELDQLGAEAADRKSQPPQTERVPLAAVPDVLDNGQPIPVVEGNKPITVAKVLNAKLANPAATQKELATITGVSDRTIRNIINGLPSELAV